MLSKNIILNKCVDSDEAISKASSCLNSILKKIKDEGVTTLLLMSGGSALKIAEHVDKDSLPEHLTVSVLDDRYSKDPEVNNFSLLSKTKLYTDALAGRAKFIDTRAKNNETLEETGIIFNESLKNWCALNPNGKIIITQGIGPDGHTSGVMPYPEDKENFKKLFIDTEKYAVGYDATGKNQYSLRITVTLKFLMDEVDESVLLMTGKDKAQAFQNLENVSGKLADAPSLVIHKMKKVNLFTDI